MHIFAECCCNYTSQIYMCKSFSTKKMSLLTKLCSSGQKRIIQKSRDRRNYCDAVDVTTCDVFSDVFNVVFSVVFNVVFRNVFSVGFNVVVIFPFVGTIGFLQTFLEYIYSLFYKLDRFIIVHFSSIVLKRSSLQKKNVLMGCLHY